MSAVTLHAHALRGLHVITLRGDLDTLQAASTATALATFTAGGHRVIADLSGLAFLDCHAVHALATVQAQARHAGGALLLAAPSPLAARLLALTGLDQALNVYPTVTAALAAAAPPASNHSPP